MKRLIAAALVTLCAAAAQAGAKEEALQLVERWAKAFAASDVDAIVVLYAPDATFFGTGSQSIVTAPAPVRAYFEAALLRDRPRGATLAAPVAVELSDTVVLVTGMDTVSGVRDGQPFASPGRVTFVLQKRPAGWQIVHFHRSAVPK